MYVHEYVCIDLPKLKEKLHDGRDFVYFVLHWILKSGGGKRREKHEEQNCSDIWYPPDGALKPVSSFYAKGNIIILG